MAAGPSFELLACRLSFVVDGIVRFPDRAANTFRGALGFVLPEEIFRPRLEGGPSGLADAPRSFVLQTKALDGQTVAGSSFGFDLNLFDPSLEPEFKRAFQSLAERGITPSRTRLRLEKWESRRVVIRLDEVEQVTRLRVTFETPTELKGWDGNGFPPFEVLACRLRDRISALKSLYGQPSPDPLQPRTQSSTRIARQEDHEALADPVAENTASFDRRSPASLVRQREVCCTIPPPDGSGSPSIRAVCFAENTGVKDMPHGERAGSWPQARQSGSPSRATRVHEPLDIDFKAFAERARSVLATGGELLHESARRTSSRTGLTHPLDGMTGWVEYEGELGEFVPYLRAATYMGVGRQTVWGHGRLKIEKLG